MVTSPRRWHVECCFAATGLPMPPIAVYADNGARASLHRSAPSRLRA
jgi:hypothetical protein